MLSVSLILLLAAAGAGAMPDYCKISTCGQLQEEHTMCMFNTSGANPGCGVVHRQGVKPADQTEILAVHNRLRAAVKKGEYASQGLPAAKELPPLTWDLELATLAQRWADQCIDEMNDYCRDVPRFEVGQNIAFMHGEKNWTIAIDYCFFDEQLENFNQTSLAYVPPSEDIYHDTVMVDTRKLTQLLWAKTTTVGCGYISVQHYFYDDDSSESDSEAYLNTYVCNYGPAGNVPGQPIYIKA